MSLFKGPMRQHIQGFKDLSDHIDIMEVKAGKEVSIPLICGPSTNLEVLVKEGDKVFIGTKIAQANERNVVPIFASVSGKVKGIQKIMHSSLKPVDHLVIENDGEYKKVRSFEPLDYKTADRATLIDFMMNAGIIGLGGAGFPAYIKYKFAKNVDKLIINAVECEPFITADYKMIQAHKNEFVTGVLAMKKMAEAKEVAIAIKKTHPDLIGFVEEAFKEHSEVKVASVPDVYPMGWERVLVRELLHKEYDKLPGEVGAVVNNATTAIAFGEALTTGTPIVEKTLTVSGTAVQKPMNVKVALGVSAHEVIEACGGYTAENVKIIAGGPMMGKTIVNDKFVIDRNMNALTILENIPFSSVACLRCGKCSDHCPSGLQPVRIAQAVKLKDTASMQKLGAMDCIECGLCTFVCPSRLDVTENVRKAKRALALVKK
ncbi:MAG: RnfABCDGE type electron transport complex subunit C [Longicatena sp.]